MSDQPSIRTLGLAVILTSILLVVSCSAKQESNVDDFCLATAIALDWNKLLLELERHTPGMVPPSTARMFAYAEIAAYEASLPGMKDYLSLDQKFAGYQKAPFLGDNFYLPASLNAAYAHIARAFFTNAPAEFQEKINHLELNYELENRQQVPDDLIQSSISFGKETAMAVWCFSLKDSLENKDGTNRFDRRFKAKNCPGCWGMGAHQPVQPLFPNWGNGQPFLVHQLELKPKPPIPFDESHSSLFFSEALEVYSISNSLSAEDKWIADFWSDETPGLTITPVGRWISITNQAIEKAPLAFPEVITTYLKVAIALSDASIVCWAGKYEYQVERPETYIKRNINPNWSPLHQSPAFPSYPSGHAVFSAAAAEVLSETFGTDFQMTDRTHLGRKEFNGKPRQFQSFRDMASEDAYSRLLLGVHFRMDSEEGLRLGEKVGKIVSAMPLRKTWVSSINTQ